MRYCAVAFAVLFGTAFALYMLWWGGTAALNRLVYENKSFAIIQVDVQTDGVIAPDQLRRWSGVKPGENLLALDSGCVWGHQLSAVCLEDREVFQVPCKSV